jgi:hypothetical protein
VPGTTMKYRDWLSGKSFKYQYDFGMDVLKKYGAIK